MGLKKWLTLGLLGGAVAAKSISMLPSDGNFDSNWTTSEVNQRKQTWSLLNQDFGSPFSEHLESLHNLAVKSHSQKSLSDHEVRIARIAIQAIERQIKRDIPNRIKDYNAQLKDPSLERRIGSRSKKPLSDREIRHRLQANLDLLAIYESTKNRYILEIFENTGIDLRK